MLMMISIGNAAVMLLPNLCIKVTTHYREGEVMSDIDSDDSNAEGFYANSYPDEDSDGDDLSHEGGNFSGGDDDDEVDDGVDDGEGEGGELSSGDDVDNYENAPVAFGRFM
jgi:hypothetical protein